MKTPRAPMRGVEVLPSPHQFSWRLSSCPQPRLQKDGIQICSLNSFLKPPKTMRNTQSHWRITWSHVAAYGGPCGPCQGTLVQSWTCDTGMHACCFPLDFNTPLPSISDRHVYLELSTMEQQRGLLSQHRKLAGCQDLIIINKCPLTPLCLRHLLFLLLFLLLLLFFLPLISSLLFYFWNVSPSNVFPELKSMILSAFMTLKCTVSNFIPWAKWGLSDDYQILLLVSS